MRMNKLFWLVAVVTVQVLVGAENLLAAEAAALNAALATITSDELYSHVAKLADDTFEGREAGSTGGHAAGVYLTKELQPLGLKPAGQGGAYYQNFGAGYRNILAVWEGSDPTLKNEYVLVGAHYDHVGYGNSQNSFGPTGRIHNGADDNASGTAAVLEIAEAFASTSLRPRRSILFAFWDGEEKGLLGSQHWVRQPTVPLSRIALAVNLDMIGRLRDQRLEVAGTRTTWGLRRLVSRENTSPDLNLDFRWTMEDNSDHHTFYLKNIPVLLIHTGLHDNYHRPSDDVELVNFAGMHQVTRLLFRTVAALADEEERPQFRELARQEGEATRRRLERSAPPLPSRLGVTWDPERSSGGLLLTRVSRGSPAERANLQPGDLITQFGSQPVASDEGFVGLVMASPRMTSITVRRAGRDEPILSPVELGGDPVRVGISWWEDDAEPGTVILNRVVPGSPAAEAGLRPGDRIYQIDGGQIDGGDFADGAALGRILETVRGPFDLQIERNGYISNFTITPLSVE
jgi:hypothetical protein